MKDMSDNTLLNTVHSLKQTSTVGIGLDSSDLNNLNAF